MPDNKHSFIHQILNNPSRDNTDYKKKNPSKSGKAQTNLDNSGKNTDMIGKPASEIEILKKEAVKNARCGLEDTKKIMLGFEEIEKQMAEKIYISIRQDYLLGNEKFTQLKEGKLGMDSATFKNIHEYFSTEISEAKKSEQTNDWQNRFKNFPDMLKMQVTKFEVATGADLKGFISL